jgi:hypothetical protein
MKCKNLRKRGFLPFVALALFSLAVPGRMSAQFGPPPPAAPPPNPRAIAPIDLTGYWVSVITEDWRFRMITPDKGDYGGVPLTQEGHQLAEAWDAAKDMASGNQCRPYGAAGLMRLPERLHITWQDDNTLRVDTDAGTQTRLFHFGGSPPQAGTPSWQGYSVASWDGMRPMGAFQLPTVFAARGSSSAPRPVADGYLKVITTRMRSGYVRKNGAPYSANAVLEEYFDGFKEDNGDTWLVVTAIVTDPQYLYQPFITSSHFKKLPDAAGWNPTPCEEK